MTSEQASLDSYDIPFYKSENIYMDQIQIQDMGKDDPRYAVERGETTYSCY